MEEQRNLNSPPPPPAKPSAENPKDLVYNVMPRAGGSGTMNVSAGSADSVSGSGSSRKWLYAMVIFLVLIILGGGAYYLLGMQTEDTTKTPVTKLPKTWLAQYFNTEACVDQAICGDDADADNDGLTNIDEFRNGTNPLNPDTDLDGLADGDETNIYKTDPMLKYTDRREIVAANDWSDGFQIKGGYDPLTPGFKFTDVRKQQIESAITTFHLHELSITTTTETVVPPAQPTSEPPK